MAYIETFPDDPNGYMQLLRIGVQCDRKELIAYAGSAFTEFVRRLMDDYADEIFEAPLRHEIVSDIERLIEHKVEGAEQLLRDFLSLPPEDALIPLAIKYVETRQSVDSDDLRSHLKISEYRAVRLYTALSTRGLITFDGDVLAYRPPAADPSQGPFARFSSAAYVSEGVQKKRRRGYVNLILGLSFIAAFYWFAKTH